MVTENEDKESQKTSNSDAINYQQNYYIHDIRETIKKRNKVDRLSTSLIYLITLFSTTIALTTIFFSETGFALFDFSENKIEILVVDQNGEPVNKAQIIFIGNGSVQSVSTDSSGYVNISKKDLSVETVDFLIRKEDFSPIIHEININKESETNKIFQLKK